jgi:predicted nucleic acid-binding protein
MKIYLDVSCLNRPFDDQSQPRIQLEANAVVIVLGRIDAGIWEEASSRMVEIEVLAIADESRRRRVLLLIPEDRIDLSRLVFERARELVGFGISAPDAVHLAAAEASGADIFLTCDDRLLRRCDHITGLKVRVANPLRWLQEQDDATDLG